MTLLLSLVMSFSALAADETCNWCTYGRAELTEKVLKVANLAPRAMLKAVRAEGACVKVMDTGRRVPKGTFTWGSIEKPTLKSREVTKLAAVMGKTMCKDEQPISRGCPTIVLAADAPKITLVHEYIHYLQLQRDPAWCPLSAKLWLRAPNEKDFKAIRDKEWDAHLFLWYNRDKMQLALDDRIAISSEVIAEAEQRKNVDGEGALFLLHEKPQDYLNEAIAEYKKKMGVRK